ncbi:MAG: hypothetical protein CMM15_03805 [Rhodospirillaceae bacterium]|nr:hypothetical protein [Rhodospirillaceae bacterium]|tara:strand:+ start:22 stop:1698 length:1677 start_codon:yes stop_codon:yes gene_type:complete
MMSNIILRPYTQIPTLAVEVEQRCITLNHLKPLMSKTIKPHFQRKGCWGTYPSENASKPNDQAYCDFLIHSSRFESNGISLGRTIHENNELFYIIDGNNRVNALVTLLETPLKIYPHLLQTLVGLLTPSEIDTMYKCTLTQIQQFDIERIFPDSNFSSEVRKAIKIAVENMRSKFSYKGEPIQTEVKINITTYMNGDQDTYALVFAETNRYVSKLSENNLLAAQLFHTSLPIYHYEEEICNEARLHYEDRDNGEVLEAEPVEIFNVFDYFLGLQNFCHKICPWIPSFMKVHNNGKAMFFKLFECYQNSTSMTPELFDEESVNEFIQNIVAVSYILQKIRLDFLRFDSNDKFLSNCSQKSEENCVRPNVTLLVIITLLALKKKGEVPQDKIIRDIKRALIYHFLCEGLADNEETRELKLLDGLKFPSGGRAIMSAGLKIANSDVNHILRIDDKKSFHKLLQLYLNQEAQNPKKRSFLFINRILYSFFPDATDFLIGLSQKTQNANLYRLGNMKLDSTVVTPVFNFQFRKILREDVPYECLCTENEKKIADRVTQELFLL